MPLSAPDSAPTPAPSDLTAAVWACRSTPGHWDELRGSIGPDASKIEAIDPHLTRAWQVFFEKIGVSTLTELQARSQNLERQIRDNGVTYNVYADESGPQRPWSLDLFPLLLTPQDWSCIAAGVQQRAQLLEAVMADVYGAQQLLQQGMLPPALVHGHPGYMRAMRGVAPVGGRFLHIAAFDLARGPDGLWWMVSQRTQAPSGLGYLLENRLAVAAQFNPAFEALRVQRLAGSYRALMNGLRAASPLGEQAHLALLTPGPYNETYFEHAFLARYLGLTLVEGSDLVVREDRLFLKTLKGLEPVHGLLKRVDDAFLDPLELRPDSTLGVPGLLQAIRAGNLLVANAPGSAFLESPALLGFLPAMARHLLGQELLLPALPTWWCGERSAREAALADLPRSVIKATQPAVEPGDVAVDAVLGTTLTDAQRAAWTQRILAQPDAYTLQSYLPLAQLPTWSGRRLAGGEAERITGGLQPRSWMLRVYALADGGQNWRVLPGGMVRLAGAGQEITSMQRGGSSADAWVMTEGPVDRTTLMPAKLTPEAVLQRQRRVTSRAAENLYWLGRYTERAENSVRLARLTLEVLHGEDQAEPALLRWLAHVAQANNLVPPASPVTPQERAVFERTVLQTLQRGQDGVGFALRALKNAAAHVRERLSLESWRIIHRTHEQFIQRFAQPGAGSADRITALLILRDTSDLLAAVTGAQTDRMTRDDGWRLLSVGRHIERLIFLSQALGMALQEDCLELEGGFDAVVELFDSAITFRALYQQSRDLAALLDLLVMDRDNPRSLAWVAHTLRGRLAKLAGCAPQELDALALRLPNPNAWSLPDLCDPQGEAGQPHAALHAVLQGCLQAAYTVSDEISASYFTHSGNGRNEVHRL